MDTNEMLSKILEELNTIKVEQKGTNDRLAKIEDKVTHIENKVTKIEVVQENVTNRNIQLLFESQQRMNEKFQKLDRMEMTLNAVKSDTEVIKDVVSDHSQSIRELKVAK